MQYYGVYAAAPGQGVRLHSWPITKKQAKSMADDLHSDYAKSKGWRSVTVRLLTRDEIDEQVMKARTDFGGKGWPLSHLPPTMVRLLGRTDREHKISIHADIDSQIKELNTPFRIYKDGHSEGTIRRGDVWSNTYLKHQRELGNTMTIDERQREVIIEKPKGAPIGKEERIL